MPDPTLIVDWLSAIGALLLPISILAVVLVFRRPIIEWLTTAETVSVGPFELKREIREIAAASRQLLKDTSRLQLLIAGSRVIEGDVLLSYPLLSEEQRVECRQISTRSSKKSRS